MFSSLLQPGGFQQASATRWAVPAAIYPPELPPHPCSEPALVSAQPLQGTSWAAGVSHCWADDPVSEASGAKFLFLSCFLLVLCLSQLRGWLLDGAARGSINKWIVEGRLGGSVG